MACDKSILYGPFAYKKNSKSNNPIIQLDVVFLPGMCWPNVVDHVMFTSLNASLSPQKGIGQPFFTVKKYLTHLPFANGHLPMTHIHTLSSKSQWTFVYDIE